ncbi:unannotated protein [freshwater metagenome]|uniref:Unannotated protein n=1 Tax=freshwater metagenome TaxID=449393 RepID=A0A6J6YPY3_9ZZZZ
MITDGRVVTGGNVITDDRVVAVVGRETTVGSVVTVEIADASVTANVVASFSRSPVVVVPEISMFQMPGTFSTKVPSPETIAAP